MNVARNRDGHPLTQAPMEHVQLAQTLKEQHGQPVHPDALVDRLCPVSRALREGQERRQKGTS